MSNLPFQSSPLRKQVIASSGSSSPSKTPSKTDTDKPNLNSPKPTELQNLHLFNLKRNHFLSPEIDKENEDDVNTGFDVTAMIDPLNQAQEIMETTTLFRPTKKRRVTFQNSPPKTVLEQPAFLFDDEQDMMETNVLYNDPSSMQETRMMTQDSMQETNLLNKNDMQESHLLDPSSMQETQIMDKSDMQETQIVESEMQETQLFRDAKNNETCSLLKETNLIPKSIDPTTFNLDDYIDLHNVKGPIEQPMPSQLLNSLISEDTTQLKPIVDTSNLFKQVEPESQLSPLPLDMPENTDSLLDSIEETVNDKIESVDSSINKSTRLDLTFCILPKIQMKSYICSIIPFTRLKDAIASQFSKSVLEASEPYRNKLDTQYDLLYKEYTDLYESIPHSQLMIEFNQSDSQEQLFQLNMVQQTLEYTTANAKVLLYQQKSLRLDTESEIVLELLTSTKNNLLLLQQAMESSIQEEQSIESELVQFQQELLQLNQSIQSAVNDGNTFDSNMQKQVEQLDLLIDEQERELLMITEEIELQKHSEKTLCQEEINLKSEFDQLEVKWQQLNTVNYEDNQSLIQQQQQIEKEWKWKLIQMSPEMVEFQYNSDYGNCNVVIAYATTYTPTIVKELVNLQLKVLLNLHRHMH